jgi:hypothetical protein
MYITVEAGSKQLVNPTSISRAVWNSVDTALCCWKLPSERPLRVETTPSQRPLSKRSACSKLDLSIIFMSRDNWNYSDGQLDAACFAWPWLLSLGQMMTTATLVAKIYRVKAVTAATSSSGLYTNNQPAD